MLSDFEEAWVLGSEHLLDPKHREHLVLFSALIESLKERYLEFRQMVESCDAQLFLSLPALAVLHNLTGIVHRFAPTLQIDSLAEEVRASQVLDRVERDVLEMEETGLLIAQRVKSAGVQLMRHNAEKWNAFVNVCVQ